MRCLSFLVVIASLSLNTPAGAANFRFDAAPFALSDALTTPGRQIVPNEQFLSFNTAADVFAFDRLAGTTALVSHVPGSATTTGNSVSFHSAINGDGTVIVYGAGS